MKRGIIWAVFISLVAVGGLWSAHAATFNSTNFSVNGNLGDSAAGAQSSTNYQLTSAAGESIAGSALSKSYKLGQGYVPTLENSMQLVTQPSDLSAYWPLDGPTTNGTQAYDESQNAHNAVHTSTNANSAISGTGKVGNAWGDFNGNQYIQTSDSAGYPSGTKMTISAWIQPYIIIATQQRAIVTKWDYGVGGGVQGEWAFQLSPTLGQLRTFISTGSGDAGNNYVDTTNANLTDFTWAHVVMVYDGSLTAANRLKIFVNGVQAATNTVAGTIPATLPTGTNPVVIGEFPGLDRKWTGFIDEVKIYSRALALSEIKAEYDATNAGVPAGLSLGAVTPGASQTAAFDSIVQTSASGYTLAINQNNNLTSGGDTIPGVSGSIASPVSWSEGVTKGLGFTLYGTNATSIPGSWSSGAAYAALPGSATSFYTRSNYTAGLKDVLNMRLRLDAAAGQTTGSYTNQMTVTGTMTP